MNEFEGMDYISKNDFKPPDQYGQVVVFEYWKVNGTLCRKCVPIEDDYNLERYREWEPAREVGIGTIQCSGVKSIADIEWQRDAPTIKYPFGFRRYRMFKPYYRWKKRIRFMRQVMGKGKSFKDAWLLAWRNT